MGFIEIKSRYEEFIGKLVNDLPTPVIVVDLDLLNSNLNRLSSYFETKKAKLRPHFKSNKCVTLAKKQLTLPNTVGITCAKLSEAEKLVDGGVTDVLIANQIIGEDKVLRVAQMNKKAKVRCAVDSKLGIAQLSKAAVETKVIIGVFVELDIGMGRAGVAPGKEAIEFAELISKTPGLSFDGIQAYEGHLIMTPDYKVRKQLVLDCMKPLIKTKRVLEEKGYHPIVSAGGSGTYDITGNIDGIDEIQAGTYALMDASYQKIRPEFDYARYILATVISITGENTTANVGLKGIGNEYGSPEIIGHPNCEVLYVAEEHIVMENINVNIGDKIRIIPPHGCTTNNLYDKMFMAKNDKIVEVWPIEGRGCLE